METRPKERKWFVVVNPNAGKRRIKRDWPEIKKLLGEAGLQFDFAITQYPLHAIKLTQEAITAGHRNFIAVGGDGTFNELVNAIFLQNTVSTNEFLAALIPVGTGNDWGRMFDIPRSYKNAVQLILNGKCFRQDIGMIHYHQDQIAKKRYFLNSAGMGFDALVAHKTNRQKEKGKGNAMAYFYNLMISLFEYKPSIVMASIDGEKYNFNTFSMNVGICRYNGGGMMQLPKAIPDDGLLDVTIIKKIGLGTVLAQIRNLYTGQFIKHPKVATFRAGEVHIDIKKSGFMMEADGESLGHGPFAVSVLPKALRVIVNRTTFSS